MAKDKNNKKLPKGITWREDKQIYMARFTYQGQSYTFYDKDLKSIKKTLADKRYEVEHGLQGKADKLTLDKWYHTWLNEYKIPTVKETTVNSYKQMYSCYISNRLGNIHLSKLKPVQIQKMYNELLENGLSPKTISNIQGMFYDILEIAYKNDLIIKNPCDGVKIPRIDKKERRVLSMQEQYTLLSYLKKKQWKHIEPLIITLLGTGMRIGECLGLTWNDIDFDNKQISINKTLVYVKDLKTGKFMFKFQSPKSKASVRTIPMLSNVFTALKHQRIYQKKLRFYIGGEWQPLPEFENIVFTSFKGRPYQTGDIQHFLDKLIKEINDDEIALSVKEDREPVIMEHIHPHVLRHTFATRCFEQDMPPKTVQTFLGHSSVQLTMDLYTHILEEKKQNDMSKLEGIFDVAN